MERRRAARDDAAGERQDLAAAPLAANDPKVLAVLLETWRKLPPDDPRNVDFDEAVSLLRLSAGQKKTLAAAGASNLSTIAAALLVAPEIERQNVEVERFRALFKERKLEGPLPDPIQFAVTSQDSVAIVEPIGKVLGRGSSGGKYARCPRAASRVVSSSDRSSGIPTTCRRGSGSRCRDDPARYYVRVEGVGLVPFASTEFGGVEFGTAIARVTGLQPDQRYRYRVVRAGRFVPGATGSFRTLPPPDR